jgi:hypothetical protein
MAGWKFGNQGGQTMIGPSDIMLFIKAIDLFHHLSKIYSVIVLVIDSAQKEILSDPFPPNSGFETTAQDRLQIPDHFREPLDEHSVILHMERVALW